MLDDIRTCVNARTDFFGTYYDVPQSVQPEVVEFIKEINLLGENSRNVTEFENSFVSSGLSKRFNTLLTKCTPKALKMTAEQKEYSRQSAKEIFKEDKERIFKEAVEDVADSVSLKIESEVMEKNRQRRIEAGLDDDYTKISNACDNVEIAGGFLKKLFGKKK